MTLSVLLLLINWNVLLRSTTRNPSLSQIYPASETAKVGYFSSFIAALCCCWDGSFFGQIVELKVLLE
jgi:hypothetical protein